MVGEKQIVLIPEVLRFELFYFRFILIFIRKKSIDTFWKDTQESS